MSIRTRTSERVQTVRTGVAERIEALAGTIDKKALYAGIAATFLVGLLSLVIPIIPFFGFITGGVVGGFIAAYAAGGLVRGIVHAVVAAVVGGIVLAGLGVGQGLLLGFVFIETPTIIGGFTPAISGVFSRRPLVALIATLVVLPAFVGFDGAVGGVVGSALRWVRDRLA